MDKKSRKSEIGFLGIVACMSKQCEDHDGVLAIHMWLDPRRPGISYLPGVFLEGWKFMELFGDDTEYEYLTDCDGDMQVFTIVNEEIAYYARLDMAYINGGRLVA